MAAIEAEKEAEAERKRQRLAATQAGQAAMAMGSLSTSQAQSGIQTPAGDSGVTATVTSGTEEAGGATAPGAPSGVQ